MSPLISERFTFLVPAYPGYSGKEVITGKKRVPGRELKRD